MSARTLADFLQSVESEEILLAQRMRDRESESARGSQLAIAPAPPPLRIEAEANPCAVPTAAHELYGEF